jgi:hypothetical protein
MIDKNILKLSPEQIDSLFTEEERKTREKFMQFVNNIKEAINNEEEIKND